MRFIPNFTVFIGGKACPAGLPVEITEKDAEGLEGKGTILRDEPKKTASAAPKKTASKSKQTEDIL